jgi:hypothetical protein
MANGEASQLRRKARRGGDLRVGDFPVPAGADDNICDYVRAVYDYAVARANEAIEWYRLKRRPKKCWAIGTRAGAIVFTGLGALIPLLMAAGIRPVWGAVEFGQLAFVSLALAGGSLGLDKYWGFSADWMRYMTTQGNLQGLLEEFYLDWAIFYTCRPGQVAPEVEPMLQRTQEFLKHIRQEVDQETAEWAADYRSRLVEVEKSLGEQGKTSRVSGPRLATATGSKLDAAGVAARRESMPPQTPHATDSLPPSASAAGTP